MTRASERAVLTRDFLADRDTERRFLSSAVVTARRAHPCSLGPLLGREGCEVAAGSRALSQSLVVDGAITREWLCVPCMNAAIADETWVDGRFVGPDTPRDATPEDRAAFALAHRFEPDNVMIDEDPHYWPPRYIYDAVWDVAREFGIRPPERTDGGRGG